MTVKIFKLELRDIVQYSKLKGVEINLSVQNSIKTFFPTLFYCNFTSKLEFLENLQTDNPGWTL